MEEGHSSGSWDQMPMSVWLWVTQLLICKVWTVMWLQVGAGMTITLLVSLNCCFQCFSNFSHRRENLCQQLMVKNPTTIAKGSVRSSYA